MILTEKLTVNAEPLAIAGYSTTAPQDGMGESLTIALAKADITSIPLDADIVFEIGAGRYNELTEEVDYSWKPVISGGRLNGRSYSVKWVQDSKGGYPGDLIEFSSLSPIADRWSKAPDFPVIIYDPAQIPDAANLVPPQSDQIREIGSFPGGFRYLTPKLEPTPDFNLIKLLDRVYVEGCGFDRVITNLDPLPLDRVDITLQSGFHGAAVQYINQVALNPVAFEYNNTLYILDPTNGLPTDIPAVLLDPNCVVDVLQNINPDVLVNGVILSYKADTGTHNAGERPEEKYLEDDPTESGSGKSYTRQEVTRHVTEFYDIVSNELRRVEEHEIETRNFGYRDEVEITVVVFLNTNTWSISTLTGSVPPVVTAGGVPVTNGTPTVGDSMTVTIDGKDFGEVDRGDEVVYRKRVPGGIGLISKEIIENDYVGNTKAGHVRTIEAWFSDANQRGLPKYDTVITETNETNWTADINHPGESVQKQSITTLRGKVLEDTGKDGYVEYFPILDADTGGKIKSDLSQTVIDLDIETVIEDLKKTAVNQSNVETRVIDHLQGRLRGSNIQARPGTRSTYLPNFTIGNGRAGYIQELIKDEDSVALYGLRKTINIDVGRYDPIKGRALARRKLRYTMTPPKTIQANLQGIDFSLHRGSIVIPPLRSGFDGKYIVIATGITASGIGTPNASRRMRLDCREVKIGA